MLWFIYFHWRVFVYFLFDLVLFGTLKLTPISSYKIIFLPKWYCFRVKNSRSLHRTFNVEPLYLQHENTGLAIDYMVHRVEKNIINSKEIIFLSTGKFPWARGSALSSSGLSSVTTAYPDSRSQSFWNYN